MTDLPFETTVPVRYADHDTLGRVNNAVFASYLEEARVAFLRDVLEDVVGDPSFVIANLEIDFLAPVTSGSVDVGLGVAEVSERSFSLEYEVAADGDVVAVGSTVQVHVDPETREASALPEDWRDFLAEYRIG
ncbi:MAG: acyl-CoA thioesterase [Halanaeroarchaeum sp.]